MKILIAILNCNKLRHEADWQRKTWIKDVEGADVKFFIGRPRPEDLASDEVFVDVPDDYRSLSYKTHAIICWALEHGYDWVFKCDTDTVVAPDRLLSSDFAQHDYTGYLISHKDRDWRYCFGGPGYWLSERAMKLVAAVPVEEFAKERNEDVAVGKVLSKTDVTIHHDSRYLNNLKNDGFPNHDNDAITTHRGPISRLTEAYAQYSFKMDPFLVHRILGSAVNLPDRTLTTLLENPSCAIWKKYAIVGILSERKSPVVNSPVVREVLNEVAQDRHYKPGVTLVITSCGRPDLLKQTITSFLKYNSYPIAKTVIIEDGPAADIGIDIPKLVYLTNGEKKGQVYSIDRAYAQVDTEYIFHCEDDWEFFKPGFIEASLEILKKHRKVLQVWMRDDFGHTIHVESKTLGVPIIDPVKNRYTTLSWNPGLRRLKDYVLTGSSYANLLKGADIPELQLSKHYRELGYYAAIIPAHVRHLGNGRHVEDVRILT